MLSSGRRTKARIVQFLPLASQMASHSRAGSSRQLARQSCGPKTRPTRINRMSIGGREQSLLLIWILFTASPLDRGTSIISSDSLPVSFCLPICLCELVSLICIVAALLYSTARFDCGLVYSSGSVFAGELWGN